MNDKCILVPGKIPAHMLSISCPTMTPCPILPSPLVPLPLAPDLSTAVCAGSFSLCLKACQSLSLNKGDGQEVHRASRELPWEGTVLMALCLRRHGQI